MKYIKYITFALAFILVLAACEEKEMITYNPEEAQASNLTVPSAITLTMENETDSVGFSWSAADYGVRVSVTYSLQVAAASNFTNAITFYEGSALAYKTTVKDLNTKLLNNLGLEPDADSEVYCRVQSSINPNVDKLVSGVRTLTVKPYATVFPPIYMIGAATGGWDLAKAVEVLSSAPNLYSTITYFISNEAFRFFEQPQWDATNYNFPHFSGTVSALLENAGDGDQNFKFTGESGWYRITANLKDLSVQMEEVDEPVMYITGAATGAWAKPGQEGSHKMNFVKENVWIDTVNFISGEAFRFFPQADWGPASYNFPYFSDGTVSAMLENAGDGDENFKFTGTSGMYEITLDLNKLSVEMVNQ